MPSRRVILWTANIGTKPYLINRALDMAIAFQSMPRGCIQNMDRGPKYLSHDLKQILRRHGVKLLLRGKRNCYNDPLVETLFWMIERAGRGRHAEKISRSSSNI